MLVSRIREERLISCDHLTCHSRQHVGRTSENLVTRVTPHLAAMSTSAPTASTSAPTDASPPPQTSSTLAPPKQPGLLQRAFSKDNRATAKRFFSAYAEAWVGLTPLWLMGEALTPNTKVGTKFRRGRDNLISAAEEVRKAVSTSAQDIIVIVDSKLKDKNTDAKAQVEKTSEVLKAAGSVKLVIDLSLSAAPIFVHCYS
jgi:hypothetical protein